MYKSAFFVSYLIKEALQMKKLYLALLIVLLCFGVALADEEAVTVTVGNGVTPVNGVYSGHYYYKLYFTGSTHAQIAFSTNTQASEPGEGDFIYDEDITLWDYQDNGGYYMNTFPPAPTMGDMEALFYRTNENETWKKLVFEYNRQDTVEDDTGILTNTAYPTSLMQDYTVAWNNLSADGYVLVWQLPTGERPAFHMDGSNTSLQFSSDMMRNVYECDLEYLTGHVGDYEFWMYAYVGGQLRTSAHKTFTIAAPTADSGAQLTVTGLGANNTIPANQTFRVRVSATVQNEIQGIRLYDGTGYWDPEGMDQDGNYSRDISLNGKADGDSQYPIYAMVTFGNDTWVYTNTVTVAVHTEGTIDETQFALSKDQAVRGEYIDVTYTAAAHADHYWLDVERLNPNGGWDWWGSFANLLVDAGQGGTAKLATANMPAGTYRVRMACTGTGYRGYWGEWDQTLTVTEAEPQQGENPVKFFVSSTSVRTGDRINLSAYTDGAHWIDVYWDYENNEGWHDNWGGDSFADDRTPYWSEGDFQLVAVAWYPTDEEGSDHYPVSSEPITIHVTAPNGKIDVPQADAPAYLTVGQDLHATVPALAGAEWQDLSLSMEDEDGNPLGDDDSSFYWDVDSNGLDITIPWNDLEEVGVQAGAVLTLHVNGGVPGKSVNGSHRYIPVVAASSNQAAVLTVSGLDANNTVPVNRDLTFRITANGSDPIQGIHMFNGDGFHWGYEGPDENGVYERGHSFGQPGTHSIYAMVSFDGGQTWTSTNVVTVNATAEGYAGAFTFSLDKTTVTRGQGITVTYGASAHSDHYWVDLERYNENNQWDWYDHLADLNTETGMGGTSYLSTATLEPGRYRVGVYGDGEGYITYDAGYQEITVTDAQLADRTVLLNVSAANILTCDEYVISAYAPGAQRIEVFSDYGRNNSWTAGSWGGESFQEQRRDYWNPGDYQIVAVAYYSDDPDDRVVSAPFTMHVTAPYGNLTIDLSGLPANIIKQNDQTTADLVIPLPQNAQEMTVNVRRVSENGQDTEIFHRDGLEEQLELVISPSNLVVGENIRVYVDAFGRGYAGRDQSIEIPVLSPVAGNGAQAILEIGDANNTLVDQEIKVLVRPAQGKQIQALRFYDGRGFWENGGEITPDEHGYWFEEDGSFCAFLSYNREDVGNHSIYAYVLLTGENEWFRTNVLTVRVKALGDVGSYDFVSTQAREITVTRGQSVTFQFTDAEHANHYWLDAFDTNEWNSWNPRHIEDGNTVILMTAELPAGDYAIFGRAGGEGYRWSESNSSVLMHLVEPADHTLILSLGKTTLLTQEQTEWQVYAPGAVHLEVKAWPEDNEENFFVNRDMDSDTLSDRSNFGGHACTAYLEATATYADGDEKVSRVPITVEAPYGDLGDFTVNGNLYYAGDTVEFTIYPDQHADWFIVNEIFDATDGHGDTYYHTESNVEYGEVHFRRDNANEHLGISVYQAAEGYNDITTIMFYRPIDTSNMLNLPAALTEIEEEAFEGNHAATHVIIPVGVTAIGPRAFADCHFCTAEIPVSVTSIGEGAFTEGNVTIYGYGNSAAQRYAAQHPGVDFVQIGD